MSKYSATMTPSAGRIASARAGCHCFELVGSGPGRAIRHLRHAPGTPPDIGDPSLQGTASGAGLSVEIWTEATDAAPAGETKPVWTAACGNEQLVYVNAVPTRVQFGNMQSRFAPEQVAANTQQAIAISAGRPSWSC